MKSVTKVWLGIAAGLVIIGGIIFVGAMALAHWDFASFGTAKFETNTYVISEDFRSIAIEGDTEDITFARSDDGQCRVVFHESEKQKHFARVEGDTLTIGVVDASEWHDHLFGSDSPTITVYLPQSAYAQLAIDESTGDVTLPKDFTFDGIRIKVSTGAVECGASAFGTLDIETSTGRIRLSGVSARDMKLKVSTGRIEVESVKVGAGLAIGVSTGKALLTDVTCADFVTTGNTGSLTLADVVATGAMTIERTTGDITFERCDADELTVSTDTGDVTGSLRSAKVFMVKTGTGKVDVPETTTGGACRITTSTGNVRITVG